MTIALEKPLRPAERVQRHDANWQDYVAVRDNPDVQKIAFHEGWLWFDMGHEGPRHASFSDLMTMVFGFWAFVNSEVVLQSYGRCLLERPESHACSPDLVLYKGDKIPRWQEGQPRRIMLNRDRLPDLVGEIADTSLSLDLDEQKQLYASLGISEYWVIDVKGKRIFAFGLAETGIYEEIQVSQVLTDLPIALLEQTLERLDTETNTAAANWLMQQLQTQTPLQKLT
jgi:hypothetical protein